MSNRTGVLVENIQLDDKSAKEKEMTRLSKTVHEESSNKIEFNWINIIGAIVSHVGALYSIYLIFTSAKIATSLFAYFLYELTQVGITAGPHRLWSHRAYKAKWPLRLLLTIINTVAFQTSIIKWCRNHRVHHKYCDTNADPHNSSRGFFYCHIGWLFVSETDEFKMKEKEIDVSDLLSDPLLKFQYEYYALLAPIGCFLLPTIIPVYCWNESWTNAFLIPTLLRWVIMNHSTFLINSVSHLYGDKPYDRNINPTENAMVSVFSMGEGWHNYHHTFPWDYKAAELGSYSLNHTTAFIDFFAWLGWAYDLKTVSIDMVKKRVQRTGDGSHELWGWDDKDMTREDQEATIITHKSL